MNWLNFVDSPVLDDFLQILSYLSPRDLANAYLTKRFKSFLDHPDAKAIWTRSRVQFNAPEPPAGYSEAYWARLLFGIHCQVCQGTFISPLLTESVRRSVTPRTSMTRIGRYASVFARAVNLASEKLPCNIQQSLLSIALAHT